MDICARNYSVHSIVKNRINKIPGLHGAYSLLEKGGTDENIKLAKNKSKYSLVTKVLLEIKQGEMMGVTGKFL